MIGTALRRRVRLRHDRPGQAVVEFALIAPVLLLLVFGMIDMARGWSAHHAIADAAREGARMLAVDNGLIGVDSTTTAINTRLSRAGLDPTRAQLTYSEGFGRGEPTTVTIDYTFDFWLLDVFMSWATGEETIHLVSQITMRTE